MKLNVHSVQLATTVINSMPLLKQVSLDLVGREEGREGGREGGRAVFIFGFDRDVPLRI